MSADSRSCICPEDEGLMPNRHLVIFQPVVFDCVAGRLWLLRCVSLLSLRGLLKCTKCVSAKRSRKF